MSGNFKQLALRPWIYLSKDIWEIKTRDLPRLKGYGIRALRVPVLAIYDFLRDNCWMRASALTYYALLGIVPLLAMVMGIARGLGFEAHIEGLLLQEFGAQKEILIRVLEFAKAMLANTKGGVVNGLWMLLLFWTVIRLFGNIEKAFNQIWGFPKGRTFMRKTIDYMAVAILMPVLWVPASSAQVLIASQIQTLTKWAFLQNLGDVIQFVLLFFLPFFMIWVLFSCLYIFMPNGNIRWGSGIIAGVVAGSAFQLFQRFYIEFQVGVARSNAIYGSFAALPLFLIWLYFSWVIVLFGAEIAFAHQHSRDNDFAPNGEGISFFIQKNIALQVMQLLTKDFVSGSIQRTEKEICDHLDLPRGVVHQVLEKLESAGLVMPICKQKSNHPAYLPGLDIESITPQFVVDRLEKVGMNTLSQTDIPQAEKARETLEQFNDLLEKSPVNVALKEEK